MTSRADALRIDQATVGSRVPSHPAPVVLFAYMRAEHLRRTIESLKSNPEAGDTDLYVYCDGPKHAGHRAHVDEVRSYVEALDGFKSVTRVYREVNLGLAASVVQGVTKVVTEVGRVIVLEDDLVLSPHFLRYMNDALHCYAADEQVASIHGYSYPCRSALPETFFLKGADCWGWATWARAWAHFQHDGSSLLAELRSRRLTRAFDFGGTNGYTAMLEDQVAGRNDSWAIRWYASCYLRDMLTLYPGRTLVENIGNDGSGTHCTHTDAYEQATASSPVEVRRIPLADCAGARTAFAQFFRTRTPSTLARVRIALSALCRSMR